MNITKCTIKIAPLSENAKMQKMIGFVIFASFKRYFPTIVL